MIVGGKKRDRGGQEGMAPQDPGEMEENGTNGGIMKEMESHGGTEVPGLTNRSRGVRTERSSWDGCSGDRTGFGFSSQA